MRIALSACLALACAAPRPPAPAPVPAASPPAVPPPPAAAPVSPRPPSGPPLVIRAGTVWTVAGKTWAPGEVLIRGGRIAAVGDHVERPEGARVLELPSAHVTPGLIDTHSHLGVYPSPSVTGVSDGNETSAPVTAEVSAAHGFWPQDPGLARALAGGVTALQVLPGSANLIGGRSLTVKLRPGRSAAEMRFPGAPEGLKMACGENPKRTYGEGRKTMPVTRMGNVALVRAAFQRAREYRDKLQRHRQRLADFERNRPKPPAQPPDPPDRNLQLESLAGVLAGSTLVHWHCYRADEMLLMMDLADEFGFKVRSFHHAVEAYKIRDALARHGAGVSTWADWWGFKMESFDGIPENAALVASAGGRAIIHSDSAIGIQRLNQEAAKALAKGRAMGLSLAEEEALRWITLNPAWALGVDDRVGTVEVGKMADLVVWSGHPLSVYSRPEVVLIDGDVAYRRDAGPRRTDFELGIVEEGTP